MGTDQEAPYVLVSRLGPAVQRLREEALKQSMSEFGIMFVAMPRSFVDSMRVTGAPPVAPDGSAVHIRGTLVDTAFQQSIFAPVALADGPVPEMFVAAVCPKDVLHRLFVFGEHEGTQERREALWNKACARPDTTIVLVVVGDEHRVQAVLSSVVFGMMAKGGSA